MLGEWLLHYLVRKSCFIYLLICTLSLFAQEKIRFDNINLPDNIHNSWMHDIFQDSKGYLWFANKNGLNRYDGYELKTFRLPSDIWGAIGFHLIDEEKEAGTYKIEFSADDGSASGRKSAVSNILKKDEKYLYQMEAGDYTSNKQMILKR